MSDSPETVDFSANTGPKHQVLGPDSALSHCLRRRPLANGELSQLKNQLDSNVISTIRIDNKPLSDQQKGVAQGLLNVLEAAEIIQAHREQVLSDIGDVRKQLRAAVRCFAQAWSLPVPSWESQSNLDSTLTLGNLGRMVGLRRDHIAMDVVWQLLAHLRPTESFVPTIQPYLTVSTPLLAAGNDSGTVMRLTVDLFSLEPGAGASGGAPGTLTPDLRYLGLTEINTVAEGSSSGKTFVQHFQDIWQLTDFGRWMRGTWRLENTNPAGFTERCAPKAYTGNSAQAGLLCALLSALRNPETYNPELHRQESSTPPEWEHQPLNDRVAISAAIDLDSRRATEALSKMRLVQVGKLAKKAFGAYQYGLRTAIFCSAQKFEDDPRWKEQQKKQKERPFEIHPELWIETHPVTVEDALDSMLESNQYLRDYKQRIAEDWNGRWLNPEANSSPAATNSASAAASLTS